MFCACGATTFGETRESEESQDKSERQGACSDCGAGGSEYRHFSALPTVRWVAQGNRTQRENTVLQPGKRIGLHAGAQAPGRLPNQEAVERF